MGGAASPSTENLFKVRDEKDTKYLLEEQAQSFHHTTSKLLFMCSWARSNIQTAVAFLTMIGKQYNEDGWGKLKGLLKYLNGTKHMKLKLTVENMSLIRWWVDDSYNVHWDSRRHNWYMMTLGK